MFSPRHFLLDNRFPVDTSDDEADTAQTGSDLREADFTFTPLSALSTTTVALAIGAAAEWRIKYSLVAILDSLCS